jgi:excisionase family DNA binding protein
MADMYCDKLLRVDEVAAILGCSASTVWRWSADKKLPQPLKLGHTTRWPSSEIEALIQDLKEARLSDLASNSAHPLPKVTAVNAEGSPNDRP